MRKLLAVLGLVLALAAFGYVALPPGHVPPYDALLNRLAETELEGYCSGWAFWTGASSSESVALAERCRTNGAQAPANGYQPASHAPLSDEYDMEVVQEAFCRGVTAAGFPSASACLVQVKGLRIWPTYDASLTNSWSERWPYPGDRRGVSVG